MDQDRSPVKQPTCPWKRDSSTVSRTIGECHDSLEQENEIKSLEVLHDDLSFMGLVKGGGGRALQRRRGASISGTPP